MKQGQHRVASAVLVLLILLSAGMALFSTASAAGPGLGSTWGPDDAVAPATGWQSVSAGESRWYAFYYAGDGSRVQIQLQVEPDDGAGFVVWTPGLIKRWGAGEYVEPVGRGSEDPFAEGVLTWSGSFNTAGTYYVVVEHAGNLPGSNYTGTSYYLLDVSGSGVSLSKPTPTPTSVPAEPQTEGAAPAEPTGKLVFQTTYGGYFYSINVDGSGLQRITTGIDPVWSPGGEQIAYSRWEEPRGVWVVDADGSNEQRLFDWTETRYPAWSPEGEQIVFSRQYGGRSEEKERCFRGRCMTLQPNPKWKLGIVAADGSTFFEPLPNSEVSLTPDWSPDGNRIVYDAVHGLRVQSVDGQESYQLTTDPKDTSPVWSPDGEQVAYVHRQHDHWEIYVVDVDSGQQTRLTDTPTWPDGTAANSVSPAWSPDGHYIAFLTDRAGEWEIWIAEADGGNPRPLFDTELDGLALEYAFVSERAISWTR